MFVVGIVQNQSEMAHYGYADARPLLEKMRTGNEVYSNVLYTADNIESLSVDISENRVDAVIFASNAFNDKRIAEIVFSDNFKRVIEDNILKLGILVLHQHKLSKGETSTRNLSFLPSPYSDIEAISRPQNEKTIEGNLIFTPGSEKHIALLYPESIETEPIKKQAQTFKNLPGLYWHYWEKVKYSDWDILLEDDSTPSKNRPILLCSKESMGHRIVVSAMPLDWQKHEDLFTNLLIYIVEGRHDTAVLWSVLDKNRTFHFLINTLSSKKFPYTLYHVEQDIDRLISHVQSGVHSVLLVGPDMDLKNLGESINQTINSSVENNFLKLIKVEPKEGYLRKFSTKGRSKFAHHLLQRAELAIHSELRTGQIDGSFWSTVETLQALEQLDSKNIEYRSIADEFLKKAGQREKNGSYDETFSATCAFYWMRARYLGISNRETKLTENWILSQIDRYDDREKALGYASLVEMERLNAKNREKLSRILTDLNVQATNEFDLLIYLKAAFLLNSEPDISKIVDALMEKKNDGIWIDHATTATITCTLIDILNSFKHHPPSSIDLLSQIEGLIFGAIIKILEAFETAFKKMPHNPYPWDSKASTTVKCLQAWLKFDDLLDLPVYDIVHSLESSNEMSRQMASSQIALTVLDEIKNENKNLQAFKEKYDVMTIEYKRLIHFKRFVLLGAVPVLYLLATLLWGVHQVKGSETLQSLFVKAFSQNIATHMTIIGIIIGFASFIVGYLQLRDKPWFPKILKSESHKEAPFQPE
ncbi:hypothetical protein KJ966_28700 [bacterium]|nr:hypothetical protein [bacterium]